MTTNYLHEWLFHYNGYEKLWYAFTRETRDDYFNGTGNRYIKSKAAGKSQKPRKSSMFMFTGLGGSWFDPHVMFLENRAPADLANIDFKLDKTFEITVPM